MIFWDTSALIRCYEPEEPCHERARNLLLREKGHAGCVLIRLEALSGIRRRFGRNAAQAGFLTRLVSEHLKHFDLSPIDDRVLGAGMLLVERHALRAADALHLGAALLLSRELGRRQFRFATLDREQAEAARAERLKVLLLTG